MYQATGDTGDEQLVIDVELHGRVQLFLAITQHSIEFLGLDDSAWESIQNEATQKDGEKRGGRMNDALTHYDSPHYSLAGL